MEAVPAIALDADQLHAQEVALASRNAFEAFGDHGAGIVHRDAAQGQAWVTILRRDSFRRALWGNSGATQQAPG